MEKASIQVETGGGSGARGGSSGEFNVCRTGSRMENVLFPPFHSDFSHPAFGILVFGMFLHSAVSQSGGQVQGVLKVNGFGNAQRFKHHMDRLIIYKLFKVEPIQNTVGLR